MANQSPNQAIIQAAPGTTHIITGVTGMIYRVIGLWGSISANGTAQFQSSGGTKKMTGAMNLTAGQPFGSGPVSIENGEGLFETVSGEGFDVISTSGNFNGFV